MVPLFRRFLDDTSAAAAVEYGLIAGMIACAVIGTLQNMGVKLNAKFTRFSNGLGS